MKTKLLIVDDSRLFRSAIEKSLADESDIQVIGSVWNGVKAIEFIKSNPPDLVTLDIEMPVMDGIDTLKAIQEINASNKESRPIGVIMLSVHTQKGADITVKALQMGAFDFISKPKGKNLKESIEILHHQLVLKIRHFASKRISGTLERLLVSVPMTPETTPRVSVPSRIKALLIGVSTGGPNALAIMLPPLCEKVDVPIFVVQHMPALFTQSLAKSLNAKCRHTVVEGRNNDIVQEQHVYIAPGGRHMLLNKKQQTIRTVINDLPPENGCKPAVDFLFRSGASVYGESAIAIVLTGMGSDGAKGSGALKRVGAFIIVQDSESSVVWGMPGSVEAAGNADKILPLHKIPEEVIAMVSGDPVISDQ